MFGIDAAAELATFEAANVYAVKDLVESENLDCDFQLTRSLDVYLDEKHAKETEAAYRKLVEAGVADLHDTAFIGEKDAQRVSLYHNNLCEKVTNRFDQGFWCQRRPMCIQLHRSSSMAS